MSEWNAAKVSIYFETPNKNRRKMKQLDKSALPNWEKYKQDIHHSTPVDTPMTEAERERHRIHLEAPIRRVCQRT